MKNLFQFFLPVVVDLGSHEFSLLICVNSSNILWHVNYFVVIKRILHDGMNRMQVTGLLRLDLLLASCRFI